MQKRINQPLLKELKCILDSKSIPRQHTVHNPHKRISSKVAVYDADTHELLRIECANGHTYKVYKVKEVYKNDRV